jgi:hypothetical protein
MKLVNVTPAAFECSKCASCPAVYETENDSYVIVGKVLPAEVIEQLKGKIASDEFVIEVPRGMIDQLK